MKVKYEGFIPFEEADVADVGRHIGCSLNESLKQFYANYNGVSLELSDVLLGREGDICVTQFIPLQDVVAELEMFDFGRKVLPIAWVEGGKNVVYSLNDGLIYFLDHEVVDGYRLIARDLQDFIDKLIPAKALVKPDNFKVKEIWVDPEFLKRIQSGEFK